MVERRPAWRRLLRSSSRIVAVLVIGLPLLVAGTAAAGFGLLLFGSLPGTVPEENPQVESRPSYVYDVYGNEIGVFREFDLTVPMQKEDVPQVLKDAVIASEDRKFWSHRGIDPEGLFRAALANYREGDVVQGGSTITQQYVKERYLTAERSLERKLNEAVLATRVEQDLRNELGSDRAAKEEILFRYLDQTYFGGGAYGAGAAAQSYFRKDVSQLTLSEAALLAGVIPAPTRYGPRENFFIAEARRQDVLKAMLDEELITQDEFDQAFAEPVWYLGFGPPDPEGTFTIVHPPPDSGASAHPYFVDYVRRYLSERYGDEVVFKGGLRIETTIDPILQQLAEQAVSENLRGTAYPLEMSLVSIEPSSGYVKAFVGGRDFSVSQVNLGLGGSEGMQAGSSFKTYTVAAALEQGFGPDTRYPGGPWRMPGCVSPDPANCVLGGAGGDMASATAASSNAYFGQLIYDVGPDRVAEMANRLGVSRIALDRTYDITLTLGLYEVSPLDMAAGYTTLANHGVRPNVTPVVKVVEPDGTVLEDNSAPTGTPVLDPAIADTTTEMMRGVITGGTGRRADIGRPAVGKTGTAPRNRAAWFVGYTPQLVTSVWIGYADEPRPVSVPGVGSVQGGNVPAKTWADFMRPAHEGLPVLDFPEPGPLPAPRTDGEGEAPRRPNQRSVGSLPRDCGGPCVRSLSLPPPAPPPLPDPPDPGPDDGGGADGPPGDDQTGDTPPVEEGGPP
jgi:membrane peptidoglycan carboxypeptidase